MADGKYKPCSFYVPERDTELIRFMAAQSNMSLSMRLLMKAFLASNRHETDIDVSLMDLGDLIRSMRVDPDLFEDVPRRIRPVRSISAIEAEQARAAEQALLSKSSKPGSGISRWAGGAWTLGIGAGAGRLDSASNWATRPWSSICPARPLLLPTPPMSGSPIRRPSSGSSRICTIPWKSPWIRRWWTTRASGCTSASGPSSQASPSRSLT